MNRFEMNVAVDGRHYCRIHLFATIELEAKAKAKLLADLLSLGPSLPGSRIEFSLTCWNDVGHTVVMD